MKKLLALVLLAFSLPSAGQQLCPSGNYNFNGQCLNNPAGVATIQGQTGTGTNGKGGGITILGGAPGPGSTATGDVILFQDPSNPAIVFRCSQPTAGNVATATCTATNVTVAGGGSFPPTGITWNPATQQFTFTGTGATTISTNGGPTADLSINASNSATGGISGFINITGGSGTAGNTSGGAVNILGGNGNGSSAGGSFTISAGTGGATGAGGGVQINAGTAGPGGGGAQFFMPGGPASGTAADVTLSPATGLTIPTSGNIDLNDLNGNISVQVTAAGLDNIVEPVASNSATFTISGCSATTPTGGRWAGTYKSGTAGTCTVVVTPNVPAPAPHGWRCTANDETTPADVQTQSAHTTTTCTITGTTALNDIVVFSGIAF